VVGLPRVESVPCFAALAPPVRAALAEALSEVDVPEGKRVASQGDFAYELFAIVEGTARVEQDGALVATLGPGEVFGEIGLLMTGRRTAAIVAETPMILLAMFDQSFLRLSREYPEFADAIRSQSRGRFTRQATA
jgi:CRP-like cAMP-binding protein